MKIRKLQLAARFALCEFFHDSGILFVELIQQADDQNDGFGKIQRAVHPRVVMEHILAVVRQDRADNSLIGALEHPEHQDSDCGPDAHYLGPGRLIVAKRCTLRHRRRKPGVSEY